jgi:aspartyl/asparaginyl beta-hydroxylase (cupin superfamily)
MRLKAGSSIREHRDYQLGFEDGEVRLHIPVVTNTEVEFVLDGVRSDMKEGECWYHNFNLPHRVANRGTVDRVHLVLDCVVNDWLREMLLSTEAAGTE